MRLALLSFLVAALAPLPVPATGRISPAAGALARGDLDGALRLPARDEQEALYLQGRVALARHEIETAGAVLARLRSGLPSAQLAFLLAHALGTPERIAATAAQLCGLGDPSGRSCADAEFYGSQPPRLAVEVDGAVSIPLASGMPFPVGMGRAGITRTGFILDTGASQSVISSSLAQRLGLPVTRASFPVGVAAGGSALHARLALLPSFTMGEVTVRNLPVLVLDLPELDRSMISVILSPQQVFEGHVLRIDYASSRLSVSRAGLPLAAGRSVTLPYVRAGFDLAVEARVGDGPSALFGLDTGMSHGFSVADDYASLPRGDDHVVQGAGARAALASVMAQPVRLGELVLQPQGPCLQGPLRKHDSIQLAGLLGNGLWGGGAITLDTRVRSVTITVPGPRL